MLRGPNLQLLPMSARPPEPVVASGGVAYLDDIRALMELVEIGVEGVIAGIPLYEGRFTLEEALALTAASAEDPWPRTDTDTSPGAWGRATRRREHGPPWAGGPTAGMGTWVGLLVVGGGIEPERS